MSTRIPLTDELLHEALRVPAGTEAPEAIVPEVMARVLQTLPSRSPRWLSGSLARRTGALAVVVVAIALALVSVTFLRRSPTTRVGGPTVIGPAVAIRICACAAPVPAISAPAAAAATSVLRNIVVSLRDDGRVRGGLG